MIAAKKLYPKAEMVFAGSQERSLREFFLHSASYAYAFKRVKDIDLDRITRLILVDVREPGRIGPFEEVARRSEVELHIYDHHPESDENHLRGAVEVIEPVGSTVTVFSHLFMERGIHPNADEATLMMLGLYEDTGSLMFGSTTVKDFQAAAFLLEHGANLTEVADFLTYEMTPEQVRLLHDLLANRMVLNIHGYNVSVAYASVDQFVGDLAVLTHKLRDMENLRALITVVRMGDRIFMVGRSSLPEVHVGDILSEFGGGGHAFAASATVRDLTLVQVLDRLAGVLKRQVDPRLEVRHLMSHPVKTVGPDESIEHVREFLTRYNINAVPVVEGDRVLGLLTRQVVERAAHHGLGDVAAREYMESDFATCCATWSIARPAVKADASLSKIQRRLNTTRGKSFDSCALGSPREYSICWNSSAAAAMNWVLKCSSSVVLCATCCSICPTSISISWWKATASPSLNIMHASINAGCGRIINSARR